MNMEFKFALFHIIHSLDKDNSKIFPIIALTCEL